jgi:hypothetical protein
MRLPRVEESPREALDSEAVAVRMAPALIDKTNAMPVGPPCQWAGIVPGHWQPGATRPR